MSKLNHSILIIDDDPGILESAVMFLEEYFSLVKDLNSPQEITDCLNENDFDVILLDMNFRKGSVDGKEGLYWLKYIRDTKPASVVLLMTAFGDIELAVESMKRGAFDFIQKPWKNARLLASIMAGLELRKSRMEVKKLKQTQKILTEAIDRRYEPVIGTSPAIERIINLVEKVADTDANVLLLGENGTGKDLVAHLIHRHSLRKAKPFIRVDLGSIPETLFESELFGHKKGAFTDATEDKTGRFEIATEGTIFLDEIGNLSLNMQAKLLSVLQNRKVIRLGSSKEIPIDVRLICATNMNLDGMVRQNTFREDLYYRINTFMMVIPPLRDRKSDIKLLLDHFIRIFVKKYGKDLPKIELSAVEKLEKYNWPGNVRELKNAVERAIILQEGNALKYSDFFPGQYPMDEAENKITTLDDLEKKAIIRVLRSNSGNITKSAEDLGIHRNALYRRIEKYGL